eukprot:NODE_7638_length_457_cov_24.147059_g7187_i0.p1 GENE.NODE_7638_length_457_cov_24.147059_g7187_i0~~NODE_7638_length_457_cov_24.147059_g7187_i0.p1  ORF type:complete len:117 (+),score=20.46 NODE_7638_length_457_cov_24.147059_g7187_i0:77-427(+)
MALRVTRRVMLTKGDALEKLGFGKWGNNSGPLRDLPDWEYADGTPAPTHPRFQAKRWRQSQFKAKVLIAAARAQAMAESGMLPSSPGIRRQSQEDVLLDSTTSEERARVNLGIADH